MDVVTSRVATRRAFLGVAAAMTAGPGFASIFARSPSSARLEDAVAWLNSGPLSLQALHGRVVLVQFWTHTCVNWQRTLPFVSAWHSKYKEHGLVVIGVHTPEFTFESDFANVKDATATLGVAYPVAVDSTKLVWSSFRNSAWPALYLFDAQGRVRYAQDGEGEYDRIELSIQRLLGEAKVHDVPAGLVNPAPRGSQLAANWATLRSLETYTGYAKAERFKSPGGMVPGRSRTYAAPLEIGTNQWAVAGAWLFGIEAAVASSAGARLVYRFDARDVNLVMGPGQEGRPVPFRVRIDGAPPGLSHGGDIDPGGRGTVLQPRLYQLVRRRPGGGNQLFEIEFLEPGPRVYSLTFG